MRAASSIVTLACTTLALPAQDTSPPHRTLRPTATTALEAVLGRHPFAALRAWARAEADPDRPRKLGPYPPEVDGPWFEALVCALWSDDRDVAFAAACHVPEALLDLADMDRYVRVTAPRLFDAELYFDWDTYKHVLDRGQVTRLLDVPEIWPATMRFWFLRDVHRSLRPEHVPALLRLVRHVDPVVRQQSWKDLDILALYDDQHREAVAAEFLTWPGSVSFVFDHDDHRRNPPFVPRVIELPPARAGWPPLLRATLQRAFLELQPHDKDPRFDPQLARWAEDVEPAREDLPLLQRLLHEGRNEARQIALRALGRLADRKPLEAPLHAELRELGLETKDPLLAALAFRAAGDRATVLARARDDAGALAVALEAGWREAERQVLDGVRALDAEAIELLASAREYGHQGPVRFPEQLRSALREAASGIASVEPATLPGALALCTHFPELRTKALARSLLDLCYGTTRAPDGAPLAPDGDEGLALAAMLEVHDVQDLRARLLRWADDPDARVRAVALDLAMHFGTPVPVAALLDHARAQPELDPFLLARRADPAVVEFLASRVPETVGDEPAEAACTALAALAVSKGLPEPSGRGLDSALRQAPDAFVHERWPRWRKRVLAGDASAPLLDLLQELPPHEASVPDAGRAKDDRVVAALRRLRATPGSQVQWVIGELALAGDPAALAELAQVRARGLYGWFDDATSAACTLGASLELMPFWIDEIGTNCCRRNVAAGAIEDLTGFDVHETPEHALLTQRDAALAWWTRVGPHLRWSRIANRFVVAPH